MSSSLLNFTTMAAEGSNLPMPAPGYGVLAIAILMFLLLATLGFRSVGTRHRGK